MTKIQFRPIPKGIRVTAESATHVLEKEMSLGEARHLLLEMARAIGVAADEAEKGKQIAHRTPFLEVKDPHFQMATNKRGDALIALIAGPMPPMQFTLTDERALDLCRLLREIVETPRDIRTAGVS